MLLLAWGISVFGDPFYEGSTRNFLLGGCQSHALVIGLVVRTGLNAQHKTAQDQHSRWKCSQNNNNTRIYFYETIQIMFKTYYLILLMQIGAKTTVVNKI